MVVKARGGMLLAVAAGALVAVASAGVAQDKLALVTARQDFMKAQAGDVKAISNYAKGQGDQASALKAADDLLARAPKIPDQFTPGTSVTDFPDKSEAKPEIFTAGDKVKTLSGNVASAETKLKDAVASGNVQAVGDNLGAVGKACGACHNDYRVKKS